MDPLHNYDECVQIESARCQARADCQGTDEAFDQAYPDFDNDTCIAYAKEHCRTRKIAGTGWDQRDVAKCVDTIRALKDDCDALIPRGVDETEYVDACWFIDGIDSAPPEDTETDTTESGADAGD